MNALLTSPCSIHCKENILLMSLTVKLHMFIVVMKRLEENIPRPRANPPQRREVKRIVPVKENMIAEYCFSSISWLLFACSQFR